MLRGKMLFCETSLDLILGIYDDKSKRGRQLMDQIQVVSTRVVSCDGNGDGLGHPRVYLNLGDKGQVECPYCSRQFILRESTSAQ